MASHVTDGTHKKGALRNELLLKTLQPKKAALSFERSLSRNL